MKTNEYISPLSSILKYSGLNSTQVLDDYRDQVLYSGDFSDAAAVVEKLGSALGGLKMVPNAVGLGAIIISIILETVGKTLGKESMGTAEMLQRVFAQEKANEVRPLSFPRITDLVQCSHMFYLSVAIMVRTKAANIDPFYCRFCRFISVK